MYYINKVKTERKTTMIRIIPGPYERRRPILKQYFEVVRGSLVTVEYLIGVECS